MKGLKVIRSKRPINFISLTELSHLKYELSQASDAALDFVAYQSKKASPKAANIHNRWLSCRRQRSLRFHE